MNRRFFLQRLGSLAVLATVQCKTTSPANLSLSTADLVDMFEDTPSRMRNIETILRLPFERISQNLHLSEKTELTILYPGAGDHIAPLELGIQLQKRHLNIASVHFLLTDISDDVALSFEDSLRMLYPLMRILQKEVREYGSPRTCIESLGGGVQITSASITPKEVTYEIDAFGRRMRVTYALGRSTDEKDHPYFKRTYARAADIILFHDSFWRHDEVGSALAYLLADEQLLATQKAILFEDSTTIGKVPSDPTFFTRLPGEIVYTVGVWGCNHPAVITYFPNSSRLRSLKQDKESWRAFEQYLEELYLAQMHGK